MDTKKVKLIAFDLDGTLTQHKQPLTGKNLETMYQLAGKYKLVMAGAGQARRVFNQMILQMQFSNQLCHDFFHDNS